MKFKSDIEVQAGLKDSSGANGTSGQILSSNGTTVSWINAGSSTASDVQNQVKAGVAINKGQAVYVTGADGTNIIVGLASNTSEATSSKTLGLLNATVAVNGFADVVQIGKLAGLNTSTAVIGDPVWLGTNGNLIYGLANKPYAPAHLVYIGVVTRVNANNGEIFVTVQNGFELKEIHDVDIITTPPVNGDVLGYNGTLWVNKTIPGWLGYTPVTDARTITINGTAQDLSANRTWSVGTVTSVAALTLGTSGTDLSSTVATGTTTPVITLNVPTASAANRGALSATDWSTFNTKVGGVTASSPLASSGGSTPNITIQQASGSQNGYLSSTDWTTFNNKQASGNYITSLTGEATASGPGAAAVTLNNASVTGKLLTGVNITGGTVQATDTMLTAFGKLQNQINGLIGSSIYQGTWNASTNTPALASGVGTRGYYYIVNVAGTTNLDGITDWFVGDWVIFDGTAWQQVDNTDAVVSVNGQTGAVSLTTDNISEGSTNLYYINSRARSALSFTAGSGAYNSTTGVITIPTNTNQLTNGSNYITLASLSGTAPIAYNNATGAISITQAGIASNGYLSSTDWNTFNNKTSNTGTVTSVSGTGGYGGLTLSGTVTTSGSLTLGGTPTGTWPISVSGNAVTVSSITNNTVLLRDSLSAPALIDTLTTSNFRTTLFGSTTNGYQISTSRWNNVPAPLSGLNAYGTMFAWAGSDTQGFIAMDYSTAGVKVGGGNGNLINWTKSLAFADGTGASGNWGINITGNAASVNTTYVTTNADFYIPFVDSNNGSPAAEFLYTVGTLKYNPNTGVLTANNFIAPATESREVSTYLPSSYTTNDLVSGTNYKWYSDIWRLGATRSGGAAAADFVVQLNGVNKLNLTVGGSLSVTGDMRSPIFYDSNNTGYYVDPASSSNINTITAQEYYTNGWFRNNDSNEGLYNQTTTQHWSSNTNGYWDASSTTNVSAIRFYTGGHVTSLRGYAYANDSNEIGFLNNAGNWALKSTSAGNVYATADFRAPIFYDSNDTSYYADLASTGQSINARGGIKTSGYNSAGSAFSMNWPHSGWIDMWGSTGQIMNISSASGLAVNLAVTGDVTAYYSDERLKDKKGNVVNALSKILSLNGFYYTDNNIAKTNGYNNDELQLGLSAQEVQKEFPEIVSLAPFDTDYNEYGKKISKSGENYLTVNYSKLVPALVEAIKEQQSQIEELKELVNKLINK
jgi:hypothetical protein